MFPSWIFSASCSAFCFSRCSSWLHALTESVKPMSLRHCRMLAFLTFCHSSTAIWCHDGHPAGQRHPALSFLPGKGVGLPFFASPEASPHTPCLLRTLKYISGVFRMRRSLWHDSIPPSRFGDTPSPGLTGAGRGRAALAPCPWPVLLMVQSLSGIPSSGIPSILTFTSFSSLPNICCLP